MSKLFILCVGGTSSRVIRSLAMLLAAGVKINASKIIPIIIDPDRANGDLSRTIDILKHYQQIQSKLEFRHNSFFNAEITSLEHILSLENKEKFTPNDFRFELNGVQNELFRDFIDYNSLDESNKALASVLFSERNLNADMEVGFKGNPNIGSVVLNQIHNSAEFINFASNFEQNDRIFIVSSIFGGTGAAGFPLLLKNIRNASPNIPNHIFLRDARIGAITVLPYFGVSPNEKSEIDKATFISKTKAALSYYKENISGNRSLNSLYYIADSVTKDYDNHEGSTEQKNDAHFVELASALAIIDFMNLSDEVVNTEEGKAINPIYKEFGIKEDVPAIHVNHLGTTTQKLILKPLCQFVYFYLYLRDEISVSLNKQPWSKDGKVKIDGNFISQAFYNEHITKFNQAFWEWLTELSRNRISFTPFNLSISKENIFYVINGLKPRESLLSKKNYVFFNDRLNDVVSKVGDLSVEQKFMAIFSKATENIIAERLGEIGK